MHRRVGMTHGNIRRVPTRTSVLWAAWIAMLILPVAASAAPGERVVSFEGPAPEARFFLKASNGYRVFVEGDDGKITVTVDRRDVTAIYAVDGEVSTQGMSARIGSLGRIRVDFRPAGKPVQLVPSEQCRGKGQLVWEGIFVGTIRFRGESGYTRLARNRVRGTTAVPRSWRCRPMRGNNDAPPLGVPVLGAFTSHPHVGFAAITESEIEDLRFFVGGMFERRGSMRVERSASADGKPYTFDVQSDLSAATVSPPRPFSGTASYVRNADGSTSWSGNLSVALPGAGKVPLTGPNFTVELAKPKTPAELLGLIGFPAGH